MLRQTTPKRFTSASTPGGRLFAQVPLLLGAQRPEETEQNTVLDAEKPVRLVGVLNPVRVDEQLAHALIGLSAPRRLDSPKDFLLFRSLSALGTRDAEEA